MKIAQLAPPILPVPPSSYGGSEKIVSLLTEQLVKRGHDVTLYATGDSRTRAKLKYIYKRHTGIDDFRPIDGIMHSSLVFDEQEEFDIVHIHSDFMKCNLSLAKYIKVPAVLTMHNDHLKPGTPEFKYYADTANYVFVSRNQSERLKGLKSAGVVYNGIEHEKYKFKKEKGDYCFFIGNMAPQKGPDIAARAAKELGEKLVIATKIDDAHKGFFEKEVKPHLDKKRCIFFEGLPFKKKLELYQNAKCLLFPIRWDEPFGLVMVEAMACGTPVVAMRHGAVPELVRHGVTGFVAENYRQFLSYVKRIDEIDPKDCRKWVEENFTVDKMVDGYEGVYKKVLSR